MIAILKSWALILLMIITKNVFVNWYVYLEILSSVSRHRFRWGVGVVGVGEIGLKHDHTWITASVRDS